MPTNLPPDYFEIEKRFRTAETVEERITLLKEMMSVVPKHKGTDHLRADLRKRLAKLNQETQSQKSKSKRDSIFRIPKAGAGQILLVGPSSVGKTSLWRALTGTGGADAAIPGMTWEPTAAMMPLGNIELQLVDTPPLSRDFSEPRLRDLIRRADMLLLVVDLEQDPIEQLEETADLLQDYRILPRHLQAETFADSPVTVLPILVLVNKCDRAADVEVYSLFCALLDDEWPCLPVSAVSGRNLESLKEKVFSQLELIRVYTKMPGQAPDLTTPFAFRKGSTVEDLAGKIHKDILQNMKYARVWGTIVHDGQMVQRDYQMQDGDVVEIHS
jgi:ribosome-interacting GTPase 1